jgi:hypothetical protein
LDGADAGLDEAARWRDGLLASTVAPWIRRDAVGQRGDDAVIVGVAGRPRRNTWPLGVPLEPAGQAGGRQEDRGSTKGRRILALVMAGWRFSRLARRLHLRFARSSGLSTVRSRPSVVQVQVCTSPVSTPGRS